MLPAALMRVDAGLEHADFLGVQAGPTWGVDVDGGLWQRPVTDPTWQNVKSPKALVDLCLAIDDDGSSRLYVLTLAGKVCAHLPNRSANPWNCSVPLGEGAELTAVAGATEDSLWVTGRGSLRQLQFDGETWSDASDFGRSETVYRTAVAGRSADGVIYVVAAEDAALSLRLGSSDGTEWSAWRTLNAGNQPAPIDRLARIRHSSAAEALFAVAGGEVFYTLEVTGEGIKDATELEPAEVRFYDWVRFYDVEE
jgi:hypothetical protein